MEIKFYLKVIISMQIIFLRVVENQNLIQNNPKPYLDNSSIEKNSDNKIIIKDEKDSSSQETKNIEKI